MAGAEGAGSRAGWYSYDFLDNGRHPSATRVIPELQSVAVGTVFPALATRLIVRVRGGQGHRFHGLPEPVSKPLVRVVHLLMLRRQFLGIAERAESTAPTPPNLAPVPEPEGHRV